MMVTGVSGRWRPQAPVQVTAQHNQTLISDVPVHCWDYKREDRIPVSALEDAAFPLVHRCRYFIMVWWESWGEIEQIQWFFCKNSQAFVCLFFFIAYLYKGVWKSILWTTFFFFGRIIIFFAWSPQPCWCYVSSDGHPLSCHGSMLQDNRFRLRQQAFKATMRWCNVQLPPYTSNGDLWNPPHSLKIQSAHMQKYLHLKWQMIEK